MHPVVKASIAQLSSQCGAVVLLTMFGQSLLQSLATVGDP